MDRLFESVLVIGLIFICAFSMRVNQEAMQTMQQMNQQLHLMFIKS